MLNLNTNPQTGLYFHRGGTLMAYAVLAVLTVWWVPVVGYIVGGQLIWAAQQDQQLIVAGQMDPAGHTWAQAVVAMGGVMRLVSIAVSIVLALMVVAVLTSS